MSYLYRCVILMLLGLSSLLPSAALALNLSQAKEDAGGKAPQPKPHLSHSIDLAGPADENVQLPPPPQQPLVIPKHHDDDPFTWQIGQHYQKLVGAIAQISEQELGSIVDTIITALYKNAKFFETYQDALFHNLKRDLYGWLIDSVLTWSTYDEECTPPISSADSEDEDEDPWRVAFMDGYDRDSEDEDEGEDENTSFFIDGEQEEERDFHQWQLHKLWELFGIDVDSLDDFTQNDLTLDHVRIFLKHYVQDGYSWLTNEYIEGVYGTSEDFSQKYADALGVPPDLLDSIFGGLWFNYDWEEFDVGDPLFIVKTYEKTLRRFIQGSAAGDVKERVKEVLQKALLYHSEDFRDSLRTLKEDYNKFARSRDWRNALVTWSVYSTYRKVFQKTHGDSLVTSPSPTATVLTFNKAAHVSQKLQDSLDRAHQYYTKVYPDPEMTTHVTYGAHTPAKVAKLDLKAVLSQLKAVGLAIEPYRPSESGKKRKNILVPALYAVVSDRPHIKGGNHKRVFVPIDLDLKSLKARLLTKDASDDVFTAQKAKDSAYRKQAKSDYVTGQQVRGLPKDQAIALFDKTTDRELVHSERVWLELLRDDKVVEAIVASLKKKISTFLPEKGKGPQVRIKVYSLVACFYSTNSVCPYCTPSLIAGQNSYNTGEFLDRLTQKLNKDPSLKTRGYDSKTGKQDQGKFRFSTIVTASTNFDSEAHDLTEKGQHNHTTIGKKQPPATHNPHAKLIFPEGTIDLHQEPLDPDGQRDPAQRFFYEFVGKTIHQQNLDAAPLPHPGIVFSSGGTSWSSRIPATILQK